VDTKVAEFAQKLGARIVQLRKEHNFAQERLATLARMNKGYLSSVESGQRIPSVGMLAKLSKVLQVQLFDLFVFPDGGPLDRLWEEIRIGGSPAAEQLRAHHGVGAQSPSGRTAAARPGAKQGRSLKTSAATKKQTARTQVKAASRGRAAASTRTGRKASPRPAAAQRGAVQRGGRRKAR
jgi:transcriptional regulator with XRE-family HTH domain